MNNLQEQEQPKEIKLQKVDVLTDKQEKLANKCLVKLMKEQPVKVLQYMLVQLGKEMVEANAETMELKQESDIGGKRYKIECKAKITKVKLIKNNSLNQ